MIKQKGNDVFAGLSKGLKSYGKVSVLFGVLPVAGFAVFCTKVLGLWPRGQFQHWILSENWSEAISWAEIYVRRQAMSTKWQC